MLSDKVFSAKEEGGRAANRMTSKFQLVAFYLALIVICGGVGYLVPVLGANKEVETALVAAHVGLFVSEILYELYGRAMV